MTVMTTGTNGSEKIHDNHYPDSSQDMPQSSGSSSSVASSCGTRPSGVAISVPRRAHRDPDGKRIFTDAMFADTAQMLDVRFRQEPGWSRWVIESLKMNEEGIICALVFAARSVNGGMPLDNHPDLLLAAICVLASKHSDDEPVSVKDAARVLDMKKTHLQAAERYVFDWILNHSSTFITRTECTRQPKC